MADTTNKKKIAVIFGGRSSEHEVSRKSATMVLNNMDAGKYEVYMLGITKEGEWYYYFGDVGAIADGSWERSDSRAQAFISPDAAVHGMVILRDGGAETVRLDAVFPVLHGKNGEDGSVQGLLELARIPYVGCGVAASAVCMDKALTNIVLEHGGIPQAAFVWFYYEDFVSNPAAITGEIEGKLGYPCFVKPANSGSSVGITRCSAREQLAGALELAAKHDRKIVVEANIDGQEVEVAVLGNENPIASDPGEILPADEWYDYDAKYNDAESKLLIPAKLSAETTELVKNRAIAAYKLLGCAGLTRIDFLVRRSDGEPMLNEPNTLPGFTEISMYPKLFEAAGIPNSELIDRLLECAAERAGIQ